MNDRRRLLIALGVGMLETQSMAMNALNYDALRKGLRELGYVEGQNLLIEYRSADGRPERFAELANDVVRMKVDVIVTRGTPATQAAKNATGTIPIVAAVIGDPLRSGLVKSLSRPGVTRIGQLNNLSNALVPPAKEEVETAVRSLGVQTQFFDLRKPEAIGPAFDAAIAWRAGALLIGIDIVPSANRKIIVTLAEKHRLPAVYAGREFVDAGGLMSYGVNNLQL